MTATGQGDGPFRILFVCTANVCRSVIAERLAVAELRARLGDAAAPFQVGSAGTAGRPGVSIHPYTALVLRQLGAPVGGFTSRRLSPGCIDTSDLILCAGREHLELVVAARPAVSRRAYLLKEFARLAAAAAAPAGALGPAGRAGVPGPAGGAGVPGPAGGAGVPGPAGRARAVVTEAARLRGRIPYVEPAEDEISDPKPTPAGFARCAGVIHGAVGAVLDSLCGSSS